MNAQEHKESAEGYMAIYSELLIAMDMENKLGRSVDAMLPFAELALKAAQVHATLATVIEPVNFQTFMEG